MICTLSDEKKFPNKKIEPFIITDLSGNEDESRLAAVVSHGIEDVCEADHGG